MKYIIENNKRFERFAWVSLAIIILCSLLIAFKALDGTKIRPVLTFTQGVNPANFPLEKYEYRAGETVYALTSFCKNRKAQGTTLWAIVNDRIDFYSPKLPDRELPVGCYPENQDRLVKFEVEKLSENIGLGEHYFIGSSTLILPNGKKIKVYYQTQKFNVIK